MITNTISSPRVVELAAEVLLLDGLRSFRRGWATWLTPFRVFAIRAQLSITCQVISSLDGGASPSPRRMEHFVDHDDVAPTGVFRCSACELGRAHSHHPAAALGGGVDETGRGRSWQMASALPS